MKMIFKKNNSLVCEATHAEFEKETKVKWVWSSLKF